uniref:Sema domain-containing protein n=1 Tax=Caenorhabditis japonica TaxID=281687 RepID=A0A8R1E2W3_CAEJA
MHFKNEENIRIHARNREDCRHLLSRTNSHTKALAIYDKSSKLIECSNLYQGRCRLRNLHNISEVISEAIEPRVSNDTSSSVVLFVGQGPANLTNEPVLYVGATIGSGDHDRMSVSSLFLRPQKAFEIVFPGLYGGTHVSLDYRSRGYYKYQIDYVNGFESGDYAYFVTRQRKTIHDDAPIQSRLARVCTGDKNFHSYTEVPLECTSNGIDFNLVQDVYVTRAGYELAKSLDISVSDAVLYGVFWEGDKNSYRAAEPTGKSAICMFTMREIEATFKQNIMKCYKGTSGLKKNLPWFSSNDDCRFTTLPWEGIKCGKDVNSKIGGDTPISTPATLVMENEPLLTSIAINTTRSSTVAFAGTQNGKLYKFLIENKRSAEKYATEILTENEPILADMEFSGDGKHVFVLTPSKVIKMPTSRCESLSTQCDGCLSSRDPYCGWCVSNNHCTQEESCEREVPHTSRGWLDFQNSKCPRIRSVKPDQIQINTADYLNVTIENLQAPKGRRMQCLFQFPTGDAVASEPMPFDGSLKCATPPMDRLPRIPTNEFHLATNLVVVSEGSKLPLATTNFSFYDCNRYTSCSTCASSQFPCDWCLESNECVAGKLTEDKCRKQHIVNGLNRDGNSIRKGPSKCPHIVAPVSKTSVANGERRNISVKVENADSSFMGDFKCEFKYGTVTHEKIAMRTSDDTITCDEMLFEPYGTSLLGSGSTPYGFNVIWSPISSSLPVRKATSPPRYLDNVASLAIDVYSCENLAPNCGRCLTLDADKYDCGWCSAERKCARPHQCPNRHLSDNWLNATQLCPNPVIEDFKPKKGSIFGGTRVTITGINLGRHVSDVEKAVQIANVPCEVVPEEYVPSQRIVCITGKSTVKGSNERGVVAVTLRHDSLKYFAHSTEHFSYVEPVVSSMKPVKGPRSGGTDVTLTGVDLDTGSEVSVRFGQVPCKVLGRTSGRLTCRMAPSAEGGQHPLHIAFDEQLQTLPIPIFFEFTWVF